MVLLNDARFGSSVSHLLLFQKREFHSAWVETGTPTFLIEQLLAWRLFTPDLARVMAMESLLSSFDVECIPVEALMFQTGYVTIASQMRIGARTDYTLKYPNLEVQASLNGALLDGPTGDPMLPSRQTGQLYRLMLAADFPGLHALFTAFFASIAHDCYRNNPISTATSPRRGWMCGWRT